MVEAAAAFSGTRVVVSGGAGFVGSNLVRLLLEANDITITAVDNLLSAQRENLPWDKRVTLLVGSIADDAVLAQIDDTYDYIFHLACYHGNQSSIHDPIEDHANNTVTTLKLMNHVRDFEKMKKLVYSGAGCASAEKTFDQAEATTEDAPLSLDQDSPYSISKLVGEFYAVYYHKQHNLPTVRARFQNVYGPGEILGAGRWRGTPATVWRNVTPTFIYKSLKGEALPLQAGGIATRDFIFVDDICQGLMLCATKGVPGEAYNLATGEETTVRQLAKRINALTGNPGGVQELPRRPWDHSGKRFGSTEKAKEVLGFEAQVRHEVGLERTLAWTMESLPLIEVCIAKHAKHMEGQGLQ